jgi:hypothetical protein
VDVADILSELTEHGFSDTNSNEKLRVIQDTIWDIEGRHPWPFLETTFDLDFDGGEAEPSNWPDNFRAAVRLRNRVTGRRVRPLRLEEFEDRFGANEDDAGDPLYYYFDGTQLKVWRLPSAATGLLRMRYLRWSDEITAETTASGILIPKYNHRAIVDGSLFRLYDSEDDPELALRFQQHFETGIQRMVAASFQRQFDETDVIQVVDPDDYDYFYTGDY